MSEAKPGADEVQARDTLLRLGVGPDAQPEPAAEVAPDDPEDAEPADEEPPRRRAPRMPDWWRKKPTDLADEPEEEDEEDESEEADEPENSADDDPDPESAPARQPRRRKGRRDTGNRPAYIEDRPNAPRQSLIDAYAHIPSRIRWLIYHATAAAAGYRLGWVHFSTDTAAWIADHGLTDRQALFWYGVTGGTVLLYRKFSPALLAIGWAATIPIASIVTGVLLYGSGYHR